MKCNIPYEELKKDAYSRLDLFDSRTVDEKNYFKKSDIEAGLQGYRTMAFTCNIDYIKKISGIDIQRNERNGRPQALHLEIARDTRDRGYEV